MTTATADLAVLVVDDQPDVQRYVAHVLATLGVPRVRAAGDTNEALEAVTAPGARFDIVFCDLQLLGRDGVELVHALADLGVEASLVIMSSEERRIIETVGQLAQARGLRVVAAEQKPIALDTMERILSRVRVRPRPAVGAPIIAPEGDLRDAFRLEQLRLLYQPKVHLRTQRVVGVEALVRWQHPDLGLLLPGTFVPLIEKSDALTAALNDFALQAAIGSAARWLREQRPLPVAINLSAQAFDALDLPDRLVAFSEASGLPASYVTLEVTETQLARDDVQMAEVASRLRLRRFNLAIDDFGTGHSGLAQLRRLPFNEIKIDRQFVAGCAASSTQRAMIEAAVALARDLELTTVAEGVEARDDWYAVAALGVDVVQGFHIARPMSESGLFEWVRQWDARRQ